MNSGVTETLVVIGIVQSGQKFLVGWRQPEQAIAGKAEFPGGKVEPGETLEFALKREIEEETGLAVVLTGWHREVRHSYPHGDVHLHFFLCQPVEDKKPLHPFEWVSRETLRTLPFPGANEAVLRELCNVDGESISFGCLAEP